MVFQQLYQAGLQGGCNMRTRSSRFVIAPVMLVVVLLALVSLSCSVIGPSPQQVANETSIAGIQASLDALNAQNTATATAVSGQATAVSSQATATAAQARLNHDSTATARAVSATGTAQAALGEANAPAGWKLAFYDSFDDNGSGWRTGKDDSSQFSHSDVEVEDHVYRWTAKARQGFVSWGEPRTAPSSVTDFYVEVDGKLESGEESSGYGLVARVSAQTFYAFEINEQGGWGIAVLKEGIWNAISGGRSAQIVKGGNHLAVKGIGKDFIFYVNGMQIARASDERVDRGGVGVIMDMSFGGAESTISFDNFTLLTPN